MQDSISWSNSIGNLLKNWCKWGQRGESLEDTGENLYYEEVLEISEVTSISMKPIQSITSRDIPGFLSRLELLL